MFFFIFQKLFKKKDQKIKKFFFPILRQIFFSSNFEFFSKNQTLKNDFLFFLNFADYFFCNMQRKINKLIFLSGFVKFDDMFCQKNNYTNFFLIFELKYCFKFFYKIYFLKSCTFGAN